MSAVLPSPTLPTMANFQAIIQKEIEKAVKPLLERIETLEEENTKLRLENVKVLRHVSIIEGHLNINYTDYDDFCITDNAYEDLKEEGITPFCEKVTKIEEKIEKGHVLPSDSKPDITPTIETTRDMKACAVVEFLKEDVKPNDFGEFAIGRKELTTFLQTGIKEELRVKKVSRQLKADIFKRAVELFPNTVYIKISKSGNKTQSLALKPSFKRTTTYGLIRTKPLGILA